MKSLPYFDSSEILKRASFTASVKSIEECLKNGFDPAIDLARSSLPIHGGDFLIMPTSNAQASGVKVLTVSPNSSDRTAPRIQGVYVLFEGEQLSPVALLDGAALTTIRTPSVSVAGVRRELTRRTTSVNVVVYGAGPQAVAHVEAFAEVLQPDASLEEVTYIVRSKNPEVKKSPYPVNFVKQGSEEEAEALQNADLVICATTAREPLFDSKVLKDEVVVVAVGSHEPDARELDISLMNRADVIVEDVNTALREAGDVIIAINKGALKAEHLHPLAEVVKDNIRFARRPLVFKTVGMSWEDLAIATTVFASK